MPRGSIIVQAGSVCPACGQATILQGELGLYCPKCGWYPGWRDTCAVYLGGSS